MGMEQFDDIGNNEANNSIVSQKEHGMSEFGDVLEDGIYASMMSRKSGEEKSEGAKSEHGMSEFGDVAEHANNESMVSQVSQKSEHGMSEFGDVPEGGHD
jgi:hypothetical protein